MSRKPLYIPKMVKIKLIGKDHDNLLLGYFDIKMTWELIAEKYY